MLPVRCKGLKQNLTNYPSWLHSLGTVSMLMSLVWRKNANLLILFYFCLISIQKIGWTDKQSARRLVIVITDANYHFAGDGLVGSRCHRYFSFNWLWLMFMSSIERGGHSIVGPKWEYESCRYMYCSYAFQQMGKFSNYLSLRFDFYLTPTKHFNFLNQIYLKTFIP